MNNCEKVKEIYNYIKLNIINKLIKIKNCYEYIRQGFDTKLIMQELLKNHTVNFGSIYQTLTFKFKSAQHGADCFSGK